MLLYDLTNIVSSLIAPLDLSNVSWSVSGFLKSSGDTALCCCVTCTSGLFVSLVSANPCCGLILLPCASYWFVSGASVSGKLWSSGDTALCCCVAWYSGLFASLVSAYPVSGASVSAVLKSSGDTALCCCVTCTSGLLPSLVSANPSVVASTAFVAAVENIEETLDKADAPKPPIAWPAKPPPTPAINTSPVPRPWILAIAALPKPPTRPAATFAAIGFPAVAAAAAIPAPNDKIPNKNLVLPGLALIKLAILVFNAIGALLCWTITFACCGVGGGVVDVADADAIWAIFWFTLLTIGAIIGLLPAAPAAGGVCAFGAFAHFVLKLFNKESTPASLLSAVGVPIPDTFFNPCPTRAAPALKRSHNPSSILSSNALSCWCKYIDWFTPIS